MRAMRFLLVVAAVIGAVLMMTPWIMSNIDDSAFKQDIAFTPGQITGRDGANARAIAETVRMRAEERKIPLPKDGLTVTVFASRPGTYQVAGGMMAAAATSSSAVQDVKIHASYDRPVLVVFQRHVELNVETTAPGGGVASSYP